MVYIYPVRIKVNTYFVLNSNPVISSLKETFSEPGTLHTLHPDNETQHSRYSINARGDHVINTDMRTLRGT